MKEEIISGEARVEEVSFKMFIEGGNKGPIS